MTRARELAKLGNATVISSDSQGVGIGTTDAKQDFQVGVAITMSGSAGVISATTYHGSGANLTGIGSYANDDINALSLVVAGISTLQNVTAGVATANQFSGSLTGVGLTVTGQSTVSNFNVSSGIATVAGQANFANVNVSAAFTGTTIKGTTFVGDGSALTGVGGENNITSSLFI